MNKFALFLLVFIFSLPVFSQNNNEEGTEIDFLENAMDFTIIGDNENAIKLLDKAITINPKFISAFLMRGDIKMNIKDFKGALNDYNRVIEIDPNESEAYKSRGNAKLMIKDITGAINDFSIAIEKNANDAEAYNFRGLAMAAANNYDGAIKDYNNALELNPKYSEALANKADARINLGKYFDAIKDCNIALKYSEIAIAYFFRGIAKINLGDKMGGCLDLSKAGEIGYQDAYTYIKKFCQ